MDYGNLYHVVCQAVIWLFGFASAIFQLLRTKRDFVTRDLFGVAGYSGFFCFGMCYFVEFGLRWYSGGEAYNVANNLTAYMAASGFMGLGANYQEAFLNIAYKRIESLTKRWGNGKESE